MSSEMKRRQFTPLSIWRLGCLLLLLCNGFIVDSWAQSQMFPYSLWNNTSVSGSPVFDVVKTRLNWERAAAGSLSSGERAKPQTSVEAEMFANIRLPKEAKKLSSVLRKIANVELGVTSMQALLDSMSFIITNPDESAILDALVSGVVKKVSTLETTIRKAFEEGFSKDRRDAVKDFPACDTIQLKEQFSQHKLYNYMPVSFANPCVVVADNSTVSLDVKQFLLYVAKDFMQQKALKWTIKWLYAMAVEFDEIHGGLNSFVTAEYPGHWAMTSRKHLANRWSLMDRIISDRRRNFLVVLDLVGVHSSAVRQLVEVTISFLEFLAPTDQVVVLMKTTDTCAIPRSFCSNKEAIWSMSEEKQKLIEFLDSYPSNLYHREDANASSCLESFFKERSPLQWPVVYVARAHSSLVAQVNAFTALKSIAKRRQMFINFGLLVNNSDLKFVDTHALDRIIRPSARSVSFIWLDSPFPHQLIANIVQQSLAGSTVKPDEHLFLSEMKSDSLGSHLGDDTLISLSVLQLFPRSLPSRDTTFVAVGMDVPVGDVLESFIFLPTDLLPTEMYGFVVNSKGFVVIHPRLDQAILEAVLIEQLELSSDFKDIKEVILRVAEGNLTSTSGRKYAWRHIEKTPFIGCLTWMKTDLRGQTSLSVAHVTDEMASPLQYSEMEILPPVDPHICFPATQNVKSIDTCSLYLPPAVFRYPFEHSVKTDPKSAAEEYMAYFNDSKEMTWNSTWGSPSTKHEVNLLRKMCGEWIRHFRSSLLSQNTTRRFVSTVSGTMISFPPQAMKLGYDPVIEKWFHGAFTHPGKIILTPPMSSQTDLSIVTLSHSVFNGKAKEMHTPADRISAVMGLQVTGHYLYALTVDLVPACQTVGIRCFLMTDGGYVVAHPKVNLFSESGGPMERFHVTHIESVWSTEMLAGKHPLLKKDVCYDLSSGTWQRHFTGDLSSDQMYISNESSCFTSAAVVVPGTNLFLVVTNFSCLKEEKAFCPCSLTDRLCLDCRHMGKGECECPCECPNQKNGRCGVEQGTGLLCGRRSGRVRMKELDELGPGRSPRCGQILCAARQYADVCIKDGYCEWCTGKRRKKGMFCVMRGMCTKGSVDVQPFSSGPWPSEMVIVKSSPVVPLTCGILGSFSCIFLIVVCLRYYRRTDMILPALNAQTTSSQVFYLENDNDSPSAALLGVNSVAPMGHSNAVEDVEAISPYQINPNYKPKPPANWAHCTCSSDNGYSSMSTQDDIHSPAGAGNRRTGKSLWEISEDDPILPNIRVTLPKPDGSEMQPAFSEPGDFSSLNASGEVSAMRMFYDDCTNTVLPGSLNEVGQHTLPDVRSY